MIDFFFFDCTCDLFRLLICVFVFALFFFSGQLGVGDYETRTTPVQILLPSTLISTNNINTSLTNSTTLRIKTVRCGWRFTVLLTGTILTKLKLPNPMRNNLH
jgi:hypothetical protein